MLWLTIGLAIVVAAVTIYYVARPLLQEQRSLQSTDDDALGELIARKDTVLLNIKEVEFDYRTGKLNEEDYQRYNVRLRQQAVSLIKQIEKLAPDIGDLDSELEAEIAVERQVKSQPAPTPVVPTGHSWNGSLLSPLRRCHQRGRQLLRRLRHQGAQRRTCLTVEWYNQQTKKRAGILAQWVPARFSMLCTLSNALASRLTDDRQIRGGLQLLHGAGHNHRIGQRRAGVICNHLGAVAFPQRNLHRSRGELPSSARGRNPALAFGWRF